MRGDALGEAVRARARAGDEEAFRELTEPHRRELRLHCYEARESIELSFIVALQLLLSHPGLRLLREPV